MTLDSVIHACKRPILVKDCTINSRMLGLSDCKSTGFAYASLKDRDKRGL